MEIYSTEIPFLVTAQFIDDIRSLDNEIQRRVLKRLIHIGKLKNPLDYAETLKHFETGQYRWRIGPYQVTFDQQDGQTYLLTVRHRKEVYK